MRYAKSTMRTRPAKAAPTMMGISMPSSSNWHSSAGRHKKKTLIIFKMHQIHLFDHFLLISQAIYLQQTGFHWHQRAAPAPGRCWWRNPGPRSESASHGTCKRSPGSLAGSPGFGSAPQRVLEPRITSRWSQHKTNLQTTEENRVRLTNQVQQVLSLEVFNTVNISAIKDIRSCQ